MPLRVKSLKSYTLIGTNGNRLVLSETPEHNAILVTVQEEGLNIATATVALDFAQFGELCTMDSAYDGLSVKQPEVSVEVPTADS